MYLLLFMSLEYMSRFIDTHKLGAIFIYFLLFKLVSFYGIEKDYVDHDTTTIVPCVEKIHRLFLVKFFVLLAQGL